MINNLEALVYIEKYRSSAQCGRLVQAYRWSKLTRAPLRLTSQRARLLCGFAPHPNGHHTV